MKKKLTKIRKVSRTPITGKTPERTELKGKTPNRTELKMDKEHM